MLGIRNFFRGSASRKGLTAEPTLRGGRNVYSLKFEFRAVRGTHPEAVKELNRFSEVHETFSSQIKAMPCSESEKASLALHPGASRVWGLFIITRTLLRKNVDKPLGNSEFYEMVQAPSPEKLSVAVNSLLEGREVRDIQILLDDFGKEEARWIADVSFPYDTLSGRPLDR